MDTFIVHAKLPKAWESAELWAWAEPEGGNAFEEWPGRTMCPEEKGYYYLELPGWVNKIILSTDGGKLQTEKLSISPKELWIQVKDNLELSLSYECPQIMLRAIMPPQWKAPLVWAWCDYSGKNVFDSWPGKVFHYDGEYQRISLPYWADRIIISADGCMLKSKAIELPAGDELYLKLLDAEKHILRAEPFSDWEEEKKETNEVPAEKPEKPSEPKAEPAAVKPASDDIIRQRLKKNFIAGAAIAAAAAVTAVIAIVKLIKHR